MTRFTYVIATCSALLVLAVCSLFALPVKLIWNASASTPIGLYHLHPTGMLKLGDLVVVDAPQPLAAFMVDRGYIGRGVPLLKHVAAIAGQEVCRKGPSITVDHVHLGDALNHDRWGRPLPAWQGCRRIASGEVFLMNRSVPDSLDGRYFGPLPRTSVIAQATPIYTDEQGNDHFVWRAHGARPAL